MFWLVIQVLSLFVVLSHCLFLSFFFFNDTATTEIYTLSLHDALPISEAFSRNPTLHNWEPRVGVAFDPDRKSTRLNSSHLGISYAVFCLKKKKKRKKHVIRVKNTNIAKIIKTINVPPATTKTTNLNDA